MGVLKIDKNHFITDFCEKPQNENILEQMLSLHLKETHSHEYPLLGSMGIYLFKRESPSASSSKKIRVKILANI